MIFIIEDRAFIGPDIDMDDYRRKWMELEIGPLEEWPGRPEGWTNPWPNFMNSQVESYYFRRNQWFNKAAVLMPNFCEHLVSIGYLEHQFKEI